MENVIIKILGDINYKATVPFHVELSINPTEYLPKYLFDGCSENVLGIIKDELLYGDLVSEQIEDYAFKKELIPRSGDITRLNINDIYGISDVFKALEKINYFKVEPEREKVFSYKNMDVFKSDEKFTIENGKNTVVDNLNSIADVFEFFKHLET